MAARIIGACSGRNLKLDEVLDKLDDSEVELSDSEDDYAADETYTPVIDGVESDGSLDDNDQVQGTPIPASGNGKTKSATKPKSTFQWNSPNTTAFEPGNTVFLEHFDLGEPLSTPTKYFLKYLSPDIFKTFADETNRYCLRETGRNFGTNPAEVQKFIGMSILMANLGFPRIRMFWQHATKVDRISNAMPLNRYFQLRRNLHINSAKERDIGDSNKFWKVQPLIEAVRSRCRQLPREEYCAVDEQMIPFTGRVPAKQFIKSKPNPVGVKNFVICGKSGRALDFELYQGAGTGIPEATKHLGLGASIVLRLSETIPNNTN